MIKMLRDRRKSLNLEYRKSLPIDRLVKGERRGSFAAFITPSSLSGSPERKKSERRGSFAALISPSSLRTSPERAAKRRESFASTNHHHHHHNNNNDSNFLHPSSAGDGKVRHERRGSLVQRWFKHISDAAIAYQNRDGKNRRPELSAAPLQDLEAASQEKAKESESAVSSNNNNDLLSAPATGSSAVSNNTENESSPTSPINEVDSHQTDSASRKLGSNVADPLRLTTEEQNELIQPNQVIISQRSVQTAEPILTPLEKLRRQDDMIRQALAEKQKLVADILHVPHDQFETFAEMASEPAMDKEAAELILAAVNQANQLSAAVSEALSVTEEDAVAAHTRPVKFPSVSTSHLQAISTSLNNHLSQLLNLMTEREDEREKLRREVQRSREQLHAMHELKQKFQNQGDDTLGDSTLNSQLLELTALNESQADIDTTSSGVEDNPESSTRLIPGKKTKSVENLDDTT